MSTVLETPASQTATAQTPAELVQPLTRLQGAIRRYVLLEGLAWVVIFASVWTAVAFLFDWGLLFALFGADYVRDGGPAVAWFLRSLLAGSLGVGLGAIMGYHFIYRLSATFSQYELALVLERRFPHLLGDRLLTAVPLADPAQARKYEYSWDMVQATVKEAMSRVEQLSVRQAFNWPRLMQRLTAAGLLAAGAAATGVLATDHAALWAERNLLFEDVYWPRAYILEVPDFDEMPIRAVPYGEEQRVMVRAWKWVVATRDNREGWRRLEWRDVLPGGDHPDRPWELNPPPADPALFALLPVEWQKIPLDELEARLAAPSPATRRELGLAVIQRMQAETANSSSPSRGKDLVRAAFLPYLPEAWRTETDAAALRHLLTLAETVSPEELQKLATRLQQIQPLPSDLQRALAFSLMPIQPPLPNMSAVQRGIAPEKAPVPPGLLTAGEADMLPAAWKKLPLAALVRRLQTFQRAESADAVGRLVEQKSLAMFGEFTERAQQSHIGRRRNFRRLFENVNDVEIFLTYEPVQESAEMLRYAGKSGTQQVRRVPHTNDFQYVFKKIEAPFRFRAEAERVATPWFRVNVKPVPSFRHFLQTNDEPGYIHNSNTRVTTGPHSISMIGSEWRTEAPAGSRILWEAECFKPLRSVQLVIENAPVQPVVQHAPGGTTFTARLDRFGTQTQIMQLRLTDEDGITVTRPVRLVPVPDREPLFDNLSFALVNPKMITDKARLPLAGHVSDDHGLTGLYYEVTVQHMDRRIIAGPVRVPLQQFQPFRLAGLSPADFRADSGANLTLAKVLAGLRGDPFYFAPLLARLQVLGPWGMVQLPRGDLSRRQSFEYVDEATYGPALRADHEYLDLLTLRRALGKPEDYQFAQPPFRVVVVLVGTDSRVNEDGTPRPSPQTGKSEQVFEFTVVDERTLMVEVGNREEDLHGQSQDVVNQLKKVRGDLERMSKELGNYKPEEFRKVADDLRAAAQDVAEQRQRTLAKVLLPFRAAFRELDVNRCQYQVLERLDRRICLPLTELLSGGEPFDRAQRHLLELAAQLEAQGTKADTSQFTPPVRDLNEAISRMESIMKEMQKLIEFNQALKALQELIDAQKEQNKKIEEQKKKVQQSELDP